jgi:hypothetical protein
MRAVLVLALVACGGAPELDKELDTVRSWTASVELASAELRTGAVTRRYGEQIRDRAAAALATSRTDLAVAADSPRVRSATDSLDAALRSFGAELAR